MGINITFNTDDLTPEDRAVIALAAGLGFGESETAAPAPAKKAAAAPAKKAAAKKAAAAPVVPDEPEEEPEADEDLVGGDDTEYTMADAVARATELVQASKADAVKAALADLGVAKVSHLKADQIGEFMSSVEGA